VKEKEMEMASITIDRKVTLEEAAHALQDQLGDQYKVASTRSGDKEKIRVSHALEMATVHLAPKGEATSFTVHGGGIIINRIVNEFGFSRRVCKALEASVGSPSPD
jgi:hypothetical protein